MVVDHFILYNTYKCFTMSFLKLWPLSLCIHAGMLYTEKTSCWENTVPKPFNGVSVFSVNSLVKFGYPSTGAVTRSFVNAPNVFWCSVVHSQDFCSKMVSYSASGFVVLFFPCNLDFNVTGPIR